jgi:hypothetical protein
MISLKNTLSAITSKISDINSQLSSLSWYYDYSNPTTLSDNFSSWTATANGMVVGTFALTSAWGNASFSVNGVRVDSCQSASSYALYTLKAFVKKGDKVTLAHELSNVTGCRFYPLKFGGGYNLKALLSLRWSLC